MTNTTAPAAMTKIRVLAEAQTTEALFASLLHMESGEMGNAERMVRAAICDVIEERHGLTDAIDAIYMADDFDGSYTDAMLLAHDVMVGA